MNVNLNKQPLKRFNSGRLIDQLYKFRPKWVSTASLEYPYIVSKFEVKSAKKAIKANQRIEPVVVLKDYGIVAGIHVLEAFKELGYERIPIMYGKLK